MPGHSSPQSIERETIALAKQLVARRSITPADDGCLELVGARLSAAGFRLERLDRGGVSNLWARRGTAAPVVCLAGHVDVVPPGPVERWSSDPFMPVERDGYLYGRGTADMKGAVAAFVTAAERVAAAHPSPRGSIAILLTSDEEGEAVDGTAAVVETLAARGERIDACILGEPTSSEQLGDAIKIGRRGSLSGALTVRGVQCHIAYPERGRNPIHAALPALAALAATEWDRGNESFPPTSFQISNIHAGVGAANVIPGTLDALFNFRFSTASSPDQLRSQVRALLDRHGLDYTLEWSVPSLPFLTPAGPLVERISEAIRSVTGLRPQLSTSGGISDGRFLAGVAREIVELGPLNESIHKVDERVAVADIERLSIIYERTIAALLAG
jgi:succinyl-diaminopimelate desuccinylase